MLVKSEDLIRFLQSLNWKLKNIENQYLNLLTKGENKIAFPVDTEYSGFEEDINKVLKAISKIEKIPLKEMLAKINSHREDIFEIRIESPKTNNNSLEIDYASDVVRGLTNLLLYSIAANRSPSLRTRTNSQDYLNLSNFMFNQTKVGSFIFSLSTKEKKELHEQITMNTESSAESIETKALKRLEVSFEQIGKVSENKLEITEFVNQMYKDGLTLNIAENMMKLKPKDINYEINVYISKASYTYKPKSFTFREKEFNVVERIIKELKDVETSQIEVVGRIYQLKVRRNKKEINYICITSVDEGEAKSFKIPLGDEEIVLAKKIFAENKCVYVKGILDKTKKMNEITNIIMFKEIMEP